MCNRPITVCLHNNCQLPGCPFPLLRESRNDGRNVYKIITASHDGVTSDCNLTQSHCPERKIPRNPLPQTLTSPHTQPITSPPNRPADCPSVCFLGYITHLFLSLLLRPPPIKHRLQAQAARAQCQCFTCGYGVSDRSRGGGRLL